MSVARRSLPFVGVVAILCLLAFLLHAVALHAFFVGDDFDILRKVDDLESFGEALRVTFAGNWGPVSYSQFYLNYRIGGFDPFVYHVTNVSWLCLAVVALYGFVRSAWPEEPRAAWVAALLFLTHPVNDQAISYICARSHAAGAALAMLSLWLYARWRAGAAGSPARLGWLAGALFAGFLAGLSKESALTLPAWIAAYEWLFCRREGDSLLRSVPRAVGVALLFGLAAVSVFGVRDLVIGGAPPRLEEAATRPHVWEHISTDTPVYVLLAGFPFPFSWVDLDVIHRIGLVGWLALAAAVVAGVACFLLDAARSPRSSRLPALYVLGLTIALTTICPVLAAGLELQRRYLFIANFGVVLMALAFLATLYRRLPRATPALFAILVLCGAVGTVQRNDLYRRSGNVVKSLLEAALHVPVEELPLSEPPEDLGVALVTLPHYYGGDRGSGAIVLHRTDLFALLKLFARVPPELNYAMKCHHAGDYTARAEFESDTLMKLTVSFRTETAYLAALGRDPRADWKGDLARATLVSADAEARVLTYVVKLREDLWTRYGELLLYSDDRFTALRP